VTLHQNMSEVFKVCYIVLQYCVQVGGKTCCYNKYVHDIDNFKNLTQNCSGTRQGLQRCDAQLIGTNLYYRIKF
jgi:hypothetical protein